MHQTHHHRAVASRSLTKGVSLQEDASRKARRHPGQGVTPQRPRSTASTEIHQSWHFDTRQTTRTDRRSTTLLRLREGPEYFRTGSDRSCQREESFPHQEMPRWLWMSGIAAIAASATLAALTIRELRSRRSLGRKREKGIEADADGGALPQKALRYAISPEPGSTDRRTYTLSDVSALPSMSTVFLTLVILSTDASLSIDELNNEAETTVTDPVSVESEREDLVEEGRSRCDKRSDDDDYHDDDDDDSLVPLGRSIKLGISMPDRPQGQIAKERHCCD